MTDIIEAMARFIIPDAWHETTYHDGTKRFTLVLWEEEQERARRYARDAIMALHIAGYVIVPKIPTDEMIYAGSEGSKDPSGNMYESGGFSRHLIPYCWASMIDIGRFK